MQDLDRVSNSNPQSPDRGGSVDEVKSRIVAEIENAIRRARENPSAYDKGSYYKYGKR